MLRSTLASPSLRAGILVAIVTTAAFLSTVPSLQPVSIAVVVVAAGLLGWLFVGFARAAARQRLGSHELRQLNEGLEAQIEARTADLRDAGARLGTSSAVPAGTEFELPPTGVDLESLERSLVIQALRRSAGNQTRAGLLLGLNRDQIRYRIEKFSLTSTP